MITPEIIATISKKANPNRFTSKKTRNHSDLIPEEFIELFGQRYVSLKNMAGKRLKMPFHAYLQACWNAYLTTGNLISLPDSKFISRNGENEKTCKSSKS